MIKRFFKVVREVIGVFHFPSQNSWSTFLLPSTTIDFAKYVGEGTRSNSFMAPLLWIWRASLEARVAVVTESKEGQSDLDVMHEAAKLLNNPNPYFTGASLRLAIWISWFVDGNVYLRKARDGSGKVRQLWYIPHWMIEPKWDDAVLGEFIGHYLYSPGGAGQEEIAPSEIVHLKCGVDPENVRKGYSHLKILLRAIFNDDEASNFVASLLLNGGVPGVIISPKDGNSADADSLKATKDYISASFGRSNKGKPLALGAPTEVKEFGYDPNKMNLSAVHNVTEERVCAVVGLPAAVVGFGSGMEQTQVGATLGELHRIAWIGCIIPNQDLIADELTRELRDDFGFKDNQRLGYDRKLVRALQDDLKKETERFDIGIRGGWVMVSEGREALSLPVDDTHKIFLRPMGAIEVLANGEPKDPVEPLPELGPDGKPLPPKEEEEEENPDEEKPNPGEEKPPKEDEEEDEEEAPKKVFKGTRLNAMQGRILRSNTRVRQAAERAIEKRMVAFLKRVGEEARRAFLASGSKALEDEVRVEQMFSGMKVNQLKRDLRDILAGSYAQVFDETRKVLSGVGVGVDLPDTVELEILARGGTRAGLIDFTESAKERLMERLEQAREDGEGVESIARDIEDIVPAGRFKDPRDRARLIARNESRVAQTESAVAIYRNSPGITAVRIIDARLGETDEDCEELDGQVVSFEEAQGFIADEHPNGTRDFVPVFQS